MDKRGGTQGESPAVWVILPTLNEAENIDRMIDALSRIRASEPGFAMNLVVVDDNSPDGTGAIAASHSRDCDWIEVVHRPRRLGLGSAYVEGFEFALARGADACVQMDCDFSHDPDDLVRLVDELKKGSAEVVIGSRYVAGGSTVNWNLWRRGISRFGSLYARTLLGEQVRDFTGGFKCFKRQVLERIEIDEVDCRGYAINVELTYRAIACGYRVTEIPITFVDRREGKSKMSRSTLTEAAMKVPALRFWRPGIGDPDTGHDQDDSLSPLPCQETQDLAREPA